MFFILSFPSLLFFFLKNVLLTFRLSLNDLVHTVEKLANQRMKDQDAPSPEDRKKEMLNVVADVVEKMR